jgi:hypothetical protein
MLIAPNAVSILSEKLPPYAPVANQKVVMENFAKSLNKKLMIGFILIRLFCKNRHE